MSNRIGILATASIITLGALGIHAAPYAYASPNEDQPGWSCVDDGNRVCGPGNANHVPPGCYDDGGVLFAPWPCIPWGRSDGYRHSDGTVSYASGPNAYDGGSYVGGYN